MSPGWEAIMVFPTLPSRLFGSVPAVTEKRPKWPQVAVGLERRTAQLVARVQYSSGYTGEGGFYFRRTGEEED